MIEIYGLYDPDTGQLRYVGKAKNAALRLRKHIEERHLSRPVCRWIKSLIDKGKAPKAQVLELVKESEWEAAERRLIAEHRKTSRLLNLADGGAQPSQTKEQRQNAARAAYKASIKSEAMAKLNAAKRDLGRLHSKFMKEGAWFHAYSLRFYMRCWAAENPERYGAWANL